MRTTIIAALALTLVACGDHVSSSALAASTATVAPTVALPSPTPAPTPDGPIALGLDPRIGRVSGGILAGWIYDGASGAITRDTTPPTAGPATSPKGRYGLETRNVMANGLIDHTDLWLVDQRTGTERVLYTPPPNAPDRKGAGQPNPNIPPYVYQRTEYVGSWSPDERYLTMWQIAMVSASADADGRPLVVIDVTTGARTDLGWSLLAPQAWRAPHTLAYVAGGGRETWKNKTVRIWAPESGTRDLTSAAEVGLAPAWGGDGRLWLVDGPAGEYDVATYFAGHGIGDRTIISLDLLTSARTTFPRATGYADEGVRLSDDGTLLLVLRRKLVDHRAMGAPESWIELWSARPDGSDARALLRVSAYSGFGYYGSYGSLAKLTWQR